MFLFHHIDIVVLTSFAFFRLCSSSSSLEISLFITILCLGVNVKTFDGHTGSQKPHSIHLSTKSFVFGSGF